MSATPPIQRPDVRSQPSRVDAACLHLQRRDHVPHPAGAVEIRDRASAAALLQRRRRVVADLVGDHDDDVAVRLELGARDFPRPRLNAQSAAEYDEERARSISQLYVALTRARDGLFVLCTGDPSPALEPAVEHFELIET
jgi:hypothetical protein